MPFRLTRALFRLSRTLFRRTKVLSEDQSAIRICCTPVSLSKNISGIHYTFCTDPKLKKPQIKLLSLTKNGKPYSVVLSIIDCCAKQDFNKQTSNETTNNFIHYITE